jgi:hypothetical protein
MAVKNLSIAPTLFVLVAVLGLAFLVGVIFVMMLVQPEIPHSPEQSLHGSVLPSAVQIAGTTARHSGERA